MVPVFAVGDLGPGDARRVLVEGHPVAVFNADGRLYAIDDTCTHQDASLSEGWLEGCLVECPLHASCFDLRTGAVTAPPAREPVRTYLVEASDGMVCVDLHQPGAAS
jgi:3-phenylpropionate/trans-cinnamate dioxygenase ferredoxin component